MDRVEEYRRESNISVATQHEELEDYGLNIVRSLIILTFLYEKTWFNFV